MRINRTAIAAAASVVAVVIAGTAALAANFGILDGSAAESTSAPSVVSAPLTSATVVTDNPTTTAPQVQTLAYQIEGVGVVTLERSGDSLGLLAVDAGTEWQWAQEPAVGAVALRFTSGDAVIAFAASVRGGEVVVDVVDETPVVVSDSTGSSSSYDDDHSGDDSSGDRDDDGSEDYDDD